MTIETTMACGTCGGPTMVDPVSPELAPWVGLVRPVCARCVATARAAEEQREAAVARRRLLEVRGKRLAKVGVPSHLKGYRFVDIDQPDGLDRALELAASWAAGQLQGFGMIGPMGTGKTRVGIAAANEACWRTQAHWYSAPVLIAKLGSGGFESRERQAALDALMGIGPLVLDDFDKARPTEYAAEQLFIAIDGRCDNGGQLLVTTNLRGKELAKRWPQPYGEAMADRLQLLTWTRVAGESKRGNGKGGRR